MGRKGGIWCTLLTLTCSCNIACSTMIQEEPRYITIHISCESLITKATDPQEDLLSDLSVLIFDEYGNLESSGFYSHADLKGNTGITFETSLLCRKEYSIYACANIGKPITAKSIKDLQDTRCHLAYPDEYREGIPMAGIAENIHIDRNSRTIKIPLKRLMAKVSLRIDRGGLSDDVKMDVRSVKIGNCPKSATIFRNNSVQGPDECFASGFTRSANECTILNRSTGNGISGTLSLYLLENMQGDFSAVHEIQNDSDKVFGENDIRKDICSYIEISLDYRSSTFYSGPRPLIYRFYLGEDMNNCDIERNCHYHITIVPEDDGLSDDGWRVDKSGLIPSPDEPYFSMEPSGFIQADIGEQIHVRCYVYPDNTPFEIGREELELDRERGIYEYEIDPDGYGVTIIPTGPGTGIVYMTAGEPVNESGMLVIEVNKSKNTIS